MRNKISKILWNPNWYGSLELKISNLIFLYYPIRSQRVDGTSVPFYLASVLLYMILKMRFKILVNFNGESFIVLYACYAHAP